MVKKEGKRKRNDWYLSPAELPGLGWQQPHVYPGMGTHRFCLGGIRSGVGRQNERFREAGIFPAMSPARRISIGR